MSRAHARKTAGTAAVFALVVMAVMAMAMAIATRRTPAVAQVPPCGNGLLDPGEGCDPPGFPCSSAGGAFLCSAGCQCTCGDSAIQAFEDCDPPGSPCGAFNLPCNNDCTCPIPSTTSTSTTTSSSSSTSISTVTTTSTSTSTTTTTIPTPDHYICYTTNDRSQNPPIVSVTDQFQTSDFRPKRCHPKAFCAPAGKNGAPITDPATHLKRYKVRKVTAGPTPTQTITIGNQFGTFQASLGKTTGLLVPTSKSLVGPPPPPNPALPGHQHYLCYKVKVQGFQPQTVTAQDQFGPRQYTLRRPRIFCTPASKNGSVVQDQTRHLLCYDVKGSIRPGHVFVNNQFGPHDMTLQKDGAFCVPSIKNPGATTTSSSTVTTTSVVTTTSSSILTTTSTSSSSTTSTSVATTTSSSIATTTSTSTSSSSTTSSTVATTTSSSIATTTSSSSTTSTSVATTTSTTIVPCCSAERTTLSSSPGTLKVGGFAPFPFPAGVITTIDAGTPDATCKHPVTLPPGGFAVPPFCIPALQYTSSVQTNGCETGTGVGAGFLWDGNAAAHGGTPMTNVLKVADSSDGVCDPGSGICANDDLNLLGDVDETISAGGLGTDVAVQLDIPAHSRTWQDAAGCPGNGVYNPGEGDVLITEFDFILSPTTGVATGQWVDENANGCALPGGSAGFGAPSPQCAAGAAGPCSASGVQADGPCCTVGQSTTVSTVGEAFSNSFPLYDLGFINVVPSTVSACGPFVANTCVVSSDSCKF